MRPLVALVIFALACASCEVAQAAPRRRHRPAGPPAAAVPEDAPTPAPPSAASSLAGPVPAAIAPMPVQEAPPLHNPGILLENLTWPEAEERLKPETVIVIPLGAAAKEHGPHLRLKNDWLIAEYLKRRVLEAAAVVVAPTIPYHYYPAFTEYPGSTSLRLETARDLVVDIVRSLARFGPKRFYVLNTGISTLRPLQAAAELLVNDGVLLRWSDTRQLMGEAEKAVRRQAGGSHADEIETSMMLYLAPEAVDMTRAANDYDAVGQGALTRVKGAPGTYSPTGIWGDATLATREKGERVVEALVAGVLRELGELAHASPPVPAR